MRLPLGPVIELGTVDSTQLEVGRRLLAGETPGVVFARHQTAGKGRFNRRWESSDGASFAASLVLAEHSEHRRPWLLGMAVAAAAAREVECRLQWPNDLVLAGRKVGGVLTEILPDSAGRRVPVVGLGINLGPMSLPDELMARATCLADHRRDVPDARGLLDGVLQRLASMPELSDWADLEPIWQPLDQTLGKRYRLAFGEEAVATGIGPQGELLCEINGVASTILAGDAIFGDGSTMTP